MPTVLVVEDEQVLVRVLRRMLGAQYTVLTATNLTQAIEHIEHRKPDIVVTDLQLGRGQRGEDLIKRVGGAIPCIAMTGFGDREVERHVRELGAVDYLAKPFSTEVLQQAIEAALGVSRSPTSAPTPTPALASVPLPAPVPSAPSHRPATPAETALVLSGGGVRGAYEAGVVSGIVDVLGLRRADRAPFRIFVGTSVGAINAAWLAAHAHRGDLAITGLTDLWSSLRYRELVKLDWRSLLRRRKGNRAPSLLRVGPLAELIRHAFDWNQLHRNVAAGDVKALVMPALNVRTGHSTMFAELAPGVDFHVSPDPHRVGQFTKITADHVLASAAIPGLFPPRFVDGTYYVDGGLRHNVPIAPAIRIGASHLVVVSSLSDARPPEALESGPPGLAFLLGKLLNALLLDPVQRDLQVLDRFNRLLEVLERELTPEQMARVDTVLREVRGVPYRRLRTLVFTPTEDIGALTLQVLQRELPSMGLPPFQRWLLSRLAAGSQPTAEADWATYVLFDRALARRLVDMGHRDALARADAITAFFGGTA